MSSLCVIPAIPVSISHPGMESETLDTPFRRDHSVDWRLTGWYCPFVDESTAVWDGFASGLWRAFALCGKICGTTDDIC